MNLYDRYAVYGTLRPGEANADLWAGLADSVGTATVSGFRLVTNGGFPYALPADRHDSIVVDVLAPLDPAAAHILGRRLDRLEGVPYHYRRHTVAVAIDGPPFDVVLYVPTHPSDYADLPPVPGGDWVNRPPRRSRFDLHDAVAAVAAAEAWR